MPLSKQEQKLLEDAIRKFDEDHAAHTKLVVEYDRRYRSYRALRERQKEMQDEKGYSRKPLPAYVFQSAETMVSNLVDAKPKWRLHVFPQSGDAGRMEDLLAGAKANESLLRHQLTLDHWAEKQRPFDLQGLVLGVTGSKQSWNYREGPRRSLQGVDIPEFGPRNFWGEREVIGNQKVFEEQTNTHVYRDDPTSEVVDMRHLIFQKGAVDLQNSERITHRVFKSREALMRNKCPRGDRHEGMDECHCYHNLGELKSERGKSNSEGFVRESDLHGEDPHGGDDELLEIWTREGDKLRCLVIANREVVLQNRLSPFWFDHLDHPFPFVICSGTPDLFRMVGISEVEMMAELQEMLWMFMHQRWTNLELVNNAIMLIADDVMDPDEFELEPGARFLVPRPVQDTVQWWSPDIRVAELSMNAEGMLKGDLQNVTGGMPFLSGTDSSNIDQETATGVSIVTSLAQKRLAAKRQQFVWAKGRIGEQWTALNQQFIREERLIPVIGRDGVEDFETIRPELIAGVYLHETEMVDESLMRQEKRAEAQALFTVAMQAMGPMAMAGSPINAKAFMDDFLEAYGIQDKDRYYTEQPPMPTMDPRATGQVAPEQLGMGLNGGATNPQLAAGPTAPSNSNSLSPEAAMQQFMANRGAVN